MPFCGRSFRLTSLVCQHVDRTLPLEKLTNNHFHATHLFETNRQKDVRLVIAILVSLLRLPLPYLMSHVL